MFDAKKFVKKSSLNPKEKILSEVNKASDKIKSKVTNAVASRMSQAGQAVQSVASLAAAKTDSLLSSAPSDYFSMAALGGGNPISERISGEDIINSRLGKAINEPQTVIRNSLERTDTTRLVYPEDLASQDYMLMLEFMEYKRPSVATPANTEIRFTISLPIPSVLIDNHGVSYRDSEYGANLGNLVSAIDNPSDFSGNNVVNTGVGVARGAFQSQIAGAAGVLNGGNGEGISGLADQLFGSVVNPHMSVFFAGPTLREHQFFWTFAPRNRNDSNTIKELYYRMKRAMLPSFTPDAARTTLEYPMMCKVKMMTKGGKELYPFKICVIPSMTLNYAAAGTPAFHVDGTPALIQMSLALKEIEYFTSEDIAEFDGYSEFRSINSQFNQNPVALNTVGDFLQDAGNRFTSFISGNSVSTARGQLSNIANNIGSTSNTINSPGG